VAGSDLKIMGAGGDRLHVRPAVHQWLEKRTCQFFGIVNRWHPQCFGVALRAEPASTVWRGHLDGYGDPAAITVVVSVTGSDPTSCAVASRCMG
jgi:hypothetical protein